MVICNFYHSTPVGEIEEELEFLGFSLDKAVTNVSKRLTGARTFKVPLPLLFESLEQELNDEKIYEIKMLIYTIVVVENS